MTQAEYHLPMRTESYARITCKSEEHRVSKGMVLLGCTGRFISLSAGEASIQIFKAAGIGD